MDSLDSPINTRFISGTPLAFRQMASQGSPADSRVPQTPRMNREPPENDQSVPGTPARRLNLQLRSPLTGSTPILWHRAANSQDLLRENFHSPRTPVGSDQLVPTTPDGFKPVVKPECQDEEDSSDLENFSKKFAHVDRPECYAEVDLSELRATHSESQAPERNTKSKKLKKSGLRLRQRLFQEGSSSRNLASLPEGLQTSGEEACSKTSRNSMSKRVNRDVPEDLLPSFSQPYCMLSSQTSCKTSVKNSEHSSCELPLPSFVSFTSMQTADSHPLSSTRSNLFSYDSVTHNQNLQQGTSTLQTIQDSKDGIAKQSHLHDQKIQLIKQEIASPFKSAEHLTESRYSASLSVDHNNESVSIFEEQQSGIRKDCYSARCISSLQVSHNHYPEGRNCQPQSSFIDDCERATSNRCLIPSTSSSLLSSDHHKKANQLLLFDGNDIFG